MDLTAPQQTPAPQGEEDLFTLSIIDWELGVVDRNCRKLLRVLAGIEETYAGTSNETPGGRAQLEKQLDRLQLEKAEYREKREDLVLRLCQQPGLRILFAVAVDCRERFALFRQHSASYALGLQQQQWLRCWVAATG